MYIHSSNMNISIQPSIFTANTFKRVFVIGFSIIVFGNKITPLGGLGSAMAIAGVLLYSLLKDYYAKKGSN